MEDGISDLAYVIRRGGLTIDSAEIFVNPDGSLTIEYTGHWGEAHSEVLSPKYAKQVALAILFNLEDR